MLYAVKFNPPLTPPRRGIKSRNLPPFRGAGGSILTWGVGGSILTWGVGGSILTWGVGGSILTWGVGGSILTWGVGGSILTWGLFVQIKILQIAAFS